MYLPVPSGGTEAFSAASSVFCKCHKVLQKPERRAGSRKTCSHLPFRSVRRAGPRVALVQRPSLAPSAVPRRAFRIRSVAGLGETYLAQFLGEDVQDVRPGVADHHPFPASPVLGGARALQPLLRVLGVVLFRLVPVAGRGGAPPLLVVRALQASCKRL